MSFRIVDTNVAIVANGRAEHADDECVLACIEGLEAAMQQTVLIDTLMLIIEEYRTHLSPRGAPGAGDAFFKWLWDHQGDARACGQIVITPRGREHDSFAEFPDDPALASFDRSDRKFVAVAIASGRQPVILNAVDRDWWDHRQALARNGVTVSFLCPGAMSGRG